MMGDDFADLMILPPSSVIAEHHNEHANSPPDIYKTIDQTALSKNYPNDNFLGMSAITSSPLKESEKSIIMVPLSKPVIVPSPSEDPKSAKLGPSVTTFKSKAENDNFSVTSSEAAKVFEFIRAKPAVKSSHTSDATVKIGLANENLWKKFENVQTEMIVTKSGRRMFPTLSFVVSGLEESGEYSMYVYFEPKDENTWKYTNMTWKPVGKNQTLNRETLLCKHPQSPASGKAWNSASEISFAKIKLTNNKQAKPNMGGQIIINSMSFYNPQLVIVREGDDFDGKSSLRFSIDEANFVAVTAYQNSALTQLKIDHNPFAKGFREAPQRNVLNFNPSLLPQISAMSQLNGVPNMSPFGSGAGLQGIPSNAPRQLTVQNPVQNSCHLPFNGTNPMFHMPQPFVPNPYSAPNGFYRPPIRSPFNPYMPYNGTAMPNNNSNQVFNPLLSTQNSSIPTQVYRGPYQPPVAPQVPHWPGNYGNYMGGQSFGQFPQFRPTYGSNLNSYSVPVSAGQQNNIHQSEMNQLLIPNAPPNGNHGNPVQGRKRSFAEVDTNNDVQGSTVIGQNESNEFSEPVTKATCQFSEQNLASNREHSPESQPSSVFTANDVLNAFKAAQPLSVAIPESDDFKENRNPDFNLQSYGAKNDESGPQLGNLANGYTSLLCPDPGMNHAANNFNFAQLNYPTSYHVQ